MKTYKKDKSLIIDQIDAIFTDLMNTRLKMYEEPYFYSDTLKENEKTTRNSYESILSLTKWVDMNRNKFIRCQTPQDEYVYNTLNCTYPAYVDETTSPLNNKVCIDINTWDDTKAKTRYEVPFEEKCSYQYSFISELIPTIKGYIASRKTFF